MSSSCNLSLADLGDDDVVQQIGNVSLDSVEGEEEFYVDGRLVTDKPIKFLFLRDTLAQIWRPTFGMNAKELQPRRYAWRWNSSEVVWPELRAGNRRNMPMVGQRWIALETLVERC
nr:uncharacterized protein LOC109189671 [Ipomoea trifida]